MNVTAILAALLCATPSGALPLATLADVPLPGDTSRYDYESYDPVRHRLFIAHLGASEVVVFDTRARKTLARIGGVANVHGVLAIPAIGRVYATATGSDEVVAIDADRLEAIARVAVGRYPDGMAYAPASKRLFVSAKLGGAVSVVGVDDDRRVASVKIGGEIGNSQYDAKSGHVLVNAQTSGELVEIDPATATIVARDELPLKGNHGLLIDAPNRLAFIACEDDDALLVFDLEKRHVVARFATGGAPDVLALDPGLGLLYVASESGTLALFAIEDGNVRAVAKGPLGPNAHAVAVDPESHEAYFALRDVGGRPVLRIVRPRNPQASGRM